MKLTLKNDRYEVVLGGKEDDFILSNIEDSGIPITLNSTKNMNADEETYINSQLNKRQLKITITIEADTEEQIPMKKRKLLRAINPKSDQIEIKYNDYYIKAKIDNTPVYTVIDDKCVQTTINFIFFNPFWCSKENRGGNLNNWIKNTEFPLCVEQKTETTGLELGYQDPARMKNYINDGDVEVGIKATFTFNSEVVNPVLENVTTGKFIKLKGTFKYGDIITVDTVECNLYYSTLQTREVQAFNYWDNTSDWDFYLNVGDNILKYDAQTGKEYLEVLIEYVEKYVEVW